MIRKLAASLFAIAAFAAVPGSAGAADFCVGAVPGCSGASFTGDVSGLSSAITSANGSSGPDNVFVSAGTYNVGSAFNPTFAASQDIHIIGAGVGQTVFTSSLASVAQLTFNFTTAASDASGFSLIVSGTPANATGIQVFVGTIKDFAVDQPGGLANNFHAVDLDSDATALRGSIALTSGNGVGLQFDHEMIGPDDSEGNASEISMTGGAQASIGVALSASNFTLHTLDRIRIDGFGRGVEITNGSFTIKNMLIDMRDTNAAQGLDAYNGVSNSLISADVSRLTVVGTGPFQTALAIGAGAAGSQSFGGGFVDLVLFTTDPTGIGLICQGGATNLSATVNSYAVRGADLDQNGCDVNRFNKLDLTSADPGFRDFGARDYRLKPGSPLIDAGLVGESISPNERDLLGLARVVDGDGNGSTVVDLGAFEYQRAAPTAGASGPPASPRVGAAATFSATGTDSDGDSLTFAWSFDDGTVASGQSVAHAFLTPGPHAATVTVTDESGLTASASVVVTILPLPTARLIAKPKKAFARANKGFAAPKKKQPFFTVSFTDAASAKFKLESINKQKKLKAVKGSQTLKVKSGANKFAFNGRFGGKKLKAGKYRVTITPMAADGTPGKPVTANLTLK